MLVADRVISEVNIVAGRVAIQSPHLNRSELTKPDTSHFHEERSSTTTASPRGGLNLATIARPSCVFPAFQYLNGDHWKIRKAGKRTYLSAKLGSEKKPIVVRVENRRTTAVCCRTMQASSAGITSLALRPMKLKIFLTWREVESSLPAQSKRIGRNDPSHAGVTRMRECCGASAALEA